MTGPEGLRAPTSMGVSPDGRRASPRRWPAVLAWALWTLVVLGLALWIWLDRLLGQAGRPAIDRIGAADVPYLLAAVSAATVGAVLVSRRTRHPVGWLLLGIGLAVAVDKASFGYVRYGVVARPGALPAAGYLTWVSNATVLVVLSCAGFVLLLTPTGAAPSPRWRWWARVAAAAPVVWVLWAAVAEAPLYPEYPDVTNPLFIRALPRPLLDAAGAVSALIVILALPVAAGSLVVRYRRSRGIERLQLRWMAFAAALASVLLVVAVVDLVVGIGDLVLQVAFDCCVAVLPLATGAAILRYRLYDLDRIISRTLAYGLLTVLLGLGYAAAVLGLGRLLPEGSSLVVAAATLAVAAAFQPARRRIQQTVDRRFNRRRYDAARTIQAFSTRLRDQVDLDTLEAELLAVVDQTMQPTRATLWLRPQRR